MGAMARCCAYGPQGDFIAVGFGGRVGRVRAGKRTKTDGMLRIYSTKTFEKLCEVKDAREWISDVKFSPADTTNTLVVASHDNCIHIYDVKAEYSDHVVTALKLSLRPKRFDKHNSFLTHVDYSSDGQYLQSNCGAYELLFSSVMDGNQITSATELRDVKWDTWTVPLGWGSQGIWNGSQDGSDINCVDRSHTGHLLATGDDDSSVKIFKYPSVSEGTHNTCTPSFSPSLKPFS